VPAGGGGGGLPPAGGRGGGPTARGGCTSTGGGGGGEVYEAPLEEVLYPPCPGSCLLNEYKMKTITLLVGEKLPCNVINVINVNNVNNLTARRKGLQRL